MKKFLIFVALAVAFILLTSGLAIGRKAAEDEPAESSDVTTATMAATTEAPQLNFYIEDNLLQPATSAADLAGASFDGCVGYFTYGDKTCFFEVVNFEGKYVEKADANDTIWLSNYDLTCEGYVPTWGYTTDFENVTFLADGEDCFSVSSVIPESKTQGYAAVVIFAIETSEIGDPLQFAYNVQRAGYNFLMSDPGEIEGPSADVTTEVTTEITTAPPQVDIPWPEEPGAE